MIEIRESVLNPFEELQRFQRQLETKGKYGANVSFVGTVRDFNDGKPVETMTLEHYVGMTENHLERIVAEARKRWDLIDVLIIHRIGTLKPNDDIVLTAVWAAHRAEAFEACRYLIEELKNRAPFWKKEQGVGATHWVERNN